MGLSVTTNGDRFGDVPIVTPALLRELGDFAIRLIRTRTEKRVDVHGATFKPLSAGYAKQKAAAGLPPVADLQVSGQMLNDMVVTEMTNASVSIGFVTSGAGNAVARTGRKRKGAKGSTASTFIQRSRSVGSADKAFYHSEAGAGRSRVKREFFALSEADEVQLTDAVARYLEREGL